MRRKCVAVGIILLFIGVSITPSINQSVVKASQENDLVEVTTQACGIQGYGDTTVTLTRQQYQDLEQYLVEFRARLNQTSTREEAVPIFKDAVVELDKYGLLPKGMSVERTQRLFSYSYENRLINKIQDNEKQKILPFLNYLIFGNTDVTNSFNLIKVVTNRVHLLSLYGGYDQLLICRFYWWAVEHNLHLLSYLSFFLHFLMQAYGLFGGYLSTIFPIGVFHVLTLGGYANPFGPYGEYVPSKGFIFTINRNGKQNYNGSSLYGNCTKLPILFLPIFLPIYKPPEVVMFFPAIFGFTGIKFNNLLTGRMTYIGSALYVNIIS